MQILRHLTAAAAGTAIAYLLVRERRARLVAERMAAATLETLLNAIDANDAETGAHVRRVAAYALVLARAMDLPSAERREVVRAALFHDIGKIHEALFDLVHEPSRLDRKAYEQVRTHPARGAEVLAPLREFFPSLAQAVFSHHERWDGSGYPRGLVATEIPRIARMIAIADTFDAITHTRRYRPGNNVAEAVRVLLEGRGTLFDPEIVDVALFPPVLEELVSSHRELHRRRAAGADRRIQGVDQERVPKLAFRWRTATVEQSPDGVGREASPRARPRRRGRAAAR